MELMRLQTVNGLVLKEKDETKQNIDNIMKKAGTLV